MAVAGAALGGVPWGVKGTLGVKDGAARRAGAESPRAHAGAVGTGEGLTRIAGECR